MNNTYANYGNYSNGSNYTNSTAALASVSTTIVWWKILIVIILSILSAIFAGLNLGIMGLDPKYLELLTMEPFETKQEAKEAVYARKILPLRKRGNLLLCTILIGNVAVNALFSILMSEYTTGVIGFLVSTFVILIFDEIIPQAVFKRYGLPLSASLTWLIYFFIAVTFIVAFPISAILDKCLGEEIGNVLSKSKMKRMFEMYEKEKLLTPSETKILSAALEM